MILEIHNSFCKLAGDVQPEVRELVRTILTYRNDIDAELAALYPKLNFFKSKNNMKMYHATLAQIKKLKENEWVCWFKDDVFPTGHLNIVREAIKSLGVSCQEVDHRIIPKNSLILNWYNRPHEQRYYQKEFHEIAIVEGRGVCNSAVGTGKSLMAAYLIKEFAVNTLFIVPSSGLGVQMERDFKLWFGPSKAGIVETSEVRKKKPLPPIRLMTIQSVASLQKSGDLKHLIGDVDAIFFDEIHHAGSSSYTNLLTEIDHIFYRFGFTGTFLRNDSKSLDMWGVLSNVLYRYPAFKAIQDGYLTPIKVMVHELPGRRSPNYNKEYDANYCGGEHILRKIHEIIEAAGQNEQILILVKNKDKSGKLIHEYLQAYGIENSYVSGDDDKKFVDDKIKKFNDKQVRVLIGSSVIGEGIDVRSTDQLIMAQGGKSEIVIVQAIGRAVRLYEGKTLARIHDFDFVGTKYMRKHLQQREDIYSRNFECDIERVSYD